jgi:AP2-associated kinase
MILADIQPDSLSKQLPPQPRNPAQSSSQRPSSSSSNLLHFSSSTSPPTQPSSSLQSNIQPQRRGRPARETINAKLPPMPTPPSVPSPAPTIVPSRLQLQVTGDRSSVKSPSPAASLDAFGLPAAPRPQGSTSSGFSDSFGSTQKQFRPTSRFGRGLSGTSGFGDSFDSSAPSSKAAPDVDRIAAANLEIPQTTSPIASSRQASTSTIQDDNFESRYPSIETLSSGDTSTPMARSNLISPITSPPPIVSRPSMLGNMTGGDLKQPHQHLAVQTGGPQPRSTHVTGTAFKQTFASSPSPIKSRTEYFEIQSQSQSTNAHGNEKAKQVDLMTGEDNEQMGAPLIRRASSTFHHSPSEHTKEDIRTRPEITTDDLQDSSDEEPGPESATYAPIRDPSPRPIENKTTENTRSNTLPPKDEMPSSTDRRSPSGSSQKQRPQTMYGYPSTSPQKTSSGLPIQQARPGHVRKGSINDMVTKFEGMNPPTNSNNGDKPIPEPKPKPSISSKPAQLKKPTLHTVRAEGLQQPILPTSATGARGSIPPKPLKPHGLGSMTSSGTHAAGARQGHGEAPKPDGYSRNSSGRSFPIVKPKPAFPSQAQVVTTPTPTSPSANNGSRSSSPDKQQSVNALVARWNQGEMSRKPAVKPKPVL